MCFPEIQFSKRKSYAWPQKTKSIIKGKKPISLTAHPASLILILVVLILFGPSQNRPQLKSIEFQGPSSSGASINTQQGGRRERMRGWANSNREVHMGDMGEFSLTVRLFLKTYGWRRINPVPWVPLRKPLSQCRLALVSSAGFVMPGQKPFDNSFKGGDPSFREIPDKAELRMLMETHRSESFDHSGLQRDPNLAFALERVHELVAVGRIGAANHRHLSCMGSITAPGRLINVTAPPAARLLVEDGVDVALLVPV